MPATATSNVLSFLQANNSLPSLPAVALEVVRLSQQEGTGLEEIGETVGGDPALALQLLKLSNSSLFGRTQEVTEINGALMVLGLRTVKMAAVSMAMGSVLNSANLGIGREEDYQGYWRRSVTAAVAARKLLGPTRRHLADEAFLCGLLMDMGFPVMLRSGYEPYRSVLHSVDAGHPDPAVERTALDGMGHPQLAAHLLREWQLSPQLVEPVEHHHEPEALSENATPETQLLTRVLNIADELATLVSSHRSRGGALERVQQKMSEWLPAPPQDLQEFLEEVTQQVEDLARVMEVDMGAPQEVAMLMMQAQQQLLMETMDTEAELSSARTRVAELETTASTDALTGLANRAAFDQALEREWLRRHEEGCEDSLGLIMVDIDHFKAVNDTYGHQAGDDVLRAVAGVMKTAKEKLSRAVCCRYGGEEMSVIVPDVSIDELSELAELLRSRIENLTVDTAGRHLSVTASFGGALLENEPPTSCPRSMVDHADRNLYASKNSGRNRCIVSSFQP